MNCFDLISPHSDAELPCEPEIGLCCITGIECMTIPRRELIGPSFTEQFRLVAPFSGRVGVNAFKALKFKWERMSSWVATKERFQKVSRTESRDAFFGFRDGPWAGYITTSYKKHGAFRAAVNTTQSNIWAFEDLVVDGSDRERVSDWWQAMTDFQSQGISRMTMEDMTVPPGVIAKQLAAWINFQKWAKGKHKSPLFKLLCYFLPSKDELKKQEEVVDDVPN